MKMIHATFRLQRLREKERWKVHLWSEKYFLHQSKLRKSILGHMIILNWQVLETIGMNNNRKNNIVTT
jgi:hypothetical protein